MKIKWIVLALVVITALDTSGCSGVWRRKFVRAKKGEEKESPVLVPYDYKKEFTNKQLYANHFAFWSNAESELVYCFKAKRSQKRIDTYSSYAIVEIRKLRDLLVDEKKNEMEPYVKSLEDIIARARQPNYVSSNSNKLASELNKHYSAVDRLFSYFSMQNYVLPDEHAETDTGSQPDNAVKADVNPQETQSATNAGQSDETKVQ